MTKPIDHEDEGRPWVTRVLRPPYTKEELAAFEAGEEAAAREEALEACERIIANLQGQGAKASETPPVRLGDALLDSFETLHAELKK